MEKKWVEKKFLKNEIKDFKVQKKSQNATAFFKMHFWKCPYLYKQKCLAIWDIQLLLLNMDQNMFTSWIAFMETDVANMCHHLFEFNIAWRFCFAWNANFNRFNWFRFYCSAQWEKALIYNLKIAIIFFNRKYSFSWVSWFLNKSKSGILSG